VVRLLLVLLLLLLACCLLAAARSLPPHRRSHSQHTAATAAARHTLQFFTRMGLWLFSSSMPTTSLNDTSWSSCWRLRSNAEGVRAPGEG